MRGPDWLPGPFFGMRKVIFSYLSKIDMGLGAGGDLGINSDSILDRHETGMSRFQFMPVQY